MKKEILNLPRTSRTKNEQEFKVEISKCIFVIFVWFVVIFSLVGCENPYMKMDLKPIMDARHREAHPYMYMFYTVTFDSMGGSEVAPIIGIPWEGTITAPEIPKRDFYGFFAWYKEIELKNEWDFDTDVVREDITLYARWIENTVIVTIDVEQILNEAPIFDKFTISQTGTGFDQKAMVRVNAFDFDEGSISWEIECVGIYAGEFITGEGAEFELDASDTRYNSLGNHVLALEVQKSGKIYRVNVHFTIVE